MQWQDVLLDKTLQDLPYKIELNEYGKIEMSPASFIHFLMRGLRKCRGEFSLMVLGYNFTRVLNILGSDFLRDYCAQRQENTLKNIKYC